MSRGPKPSDFWDDRETSPADISRGAANRGRVLKELIGHALSARPLDATLVARWHKGCLSGLSYVIDETLLGAYRGGDHLLLTHMGVRVGGIEGVSPYDVGEELADFFEQLQRRMYHLAARIALDQDKSQAEVREIAAVAGWAHGEWTRIHPFANGNGRTARLIANWVLSRFRLLPVVRIRPRPDSPYGGAAAASMRGDHRKITAFIVDLLEDAGRGQ